MAFRQCFFKDQNRPELTKIVLPKVLQNLQKMPKSTWWPKELNQKGFPRNIHYRTRPKGPPFQFFGHCGTFFEIFFFVKVFPIHQYLEIWSPFAIFETWIWRRLGPFPACFLVLFDSFEQIYFIKKSSCCYPNFSEVCKSLCCAQTVPTLNTFSFGNVSRKVLQTASQYFFSSLGFLSMKRGAFFLILKVFVWLWKFW